MFWRQSIQPDNGIFEREGFVSYAEVWARGDALVAAAERTMTGLARKRLVCLFVDNSAASVSAYLGFLRAEHAVLLGDSAWPVAHQWALIDQYQPEIVCWPAHIPAAELSQRLVNRERVACEQAAFLAVTRRPPDDATRPLHPDLAILLATSGTTGDTRLVRLSERAVHANAQSIVEYLGIDGDERGVTSLPMSYAYGLSIVNSHVLAGASLLCTNRSVTDSGFWQVVADCSGTSLAGVPAHYTHLRAIDYWRAPQPSIRTYTQAGGALAPALQAYHREQAALHGARLVVMYGQTEATARMAYVPPTMLESHLGTIGVAIPGGSLTIANPNPDDGAGELVYRGPNVMMGYARQRNCLSKGDELGGVLPTGDIATMDADGYFRLIGRKKRIVKPLGVRISLDHLEQVLGQRTGRPVAVVAAGDDEPIVAFFQSELIASAHSPTELPQETMVELAVELAVELRLPAGLVQVQSIAAIPRNRRGKPDYRALLERIADRVGEANAQRSAARVIAEVWTALLGDIEVGEHDSFFTVGGNSLLAIQMAYKLRERGLACTIDAIFARPTIAGLAQWLGRSEELAEVPGGDKSRAADSEPVSQRPGQMPGQTLDPMPDPLADERPLSPNQRMYWSLHRFLRASPAYNVPFMIELRGPLDVHALEAAFAAVVGRHEILRTRYVFAAGRLRQRVEPAPGNALTVIELARSDAHGEGENDRNSDSAVQEIAEREANWRFDLEAGPVIRFTLVRRDAGYHVLIIVFHHITGDGWSREVLLGELACAYSGQSLPPLPGQYADVSAQQEQSALAHKHQRLEYWRQQVHDLPPQVPLPFDRPRPRRPSGRGHALAFVVDPDTTTRLHQLARRCDVTLYMTILGAFHGFLWHISGHTDIAIGSPHAGRALTDSELLVGSFSDTLIMRLPFDPSLSFGEFLTGARAAVLSALANGPVPFARLAGMRARAVAYADWFQALFSFVNVPEARLEFAGLQARRLPLQSATAKCDLSVVLTEHAAAERSAALSGVFICSADLFTEASTRALVSRFQRLLAALCANPEQSFALVAARLERALPRITEPG